MRCLSEKSASSLVCLLLDAEHVAREHAAEHSYRATAMKAIRERLLHRYHTDHAASLLDLADSLRSAAEHLQVMPEQSAHKTRTARKTA
jgi:urease alpha subunit